MAVTNGWGKGVENNTIGWGKAADNATNGFGAVYASSAAGDTSLGSSYDADAVAYFTAIEDAGGTLTDNVKAEFNAFVVREKDAGRWSNIKRLYPYLGGVINSAIIDAVTTNAATNTNFVDGDVDSLIGLQGDGSTKYLKESENIDTILVSNSKFQVGVFFDTLNLTGVNQSFFGVQGTSPSYNLWNRIFSAGTPLYYAGYSSAFTSPSFSATSSTIARYSNTSAYALANSVEGTQQTADVSTFSLPSHKLSWFTSLVNSVTPNYYLNNKLSGGYIAEFDNLTETQAFESSYKTFINNIQAYAAYQAYFTAVETAGGTLTTNVKSEFSAFVSREVEANRWSKIKRLYPYLGGIINSAVIDAITLNSATNTNFVDGDVDSLIGLQGDGSTKSLRLTETTNLILPDSTDFQIGVFRIGAVEQPSSLSRLMGHFSSANSLGRLYLQKNQLQPQVFATDNVVAAGGVLSTDSSHIGASFSSSDLNVLLDGVVVNTNSTARSTSFSTDLMDLFALNINGTPSSFSSIKSGGMFIASGLSLTETQAFESSYKTFINNITA